MATPKAKLKTMPTGILKNEAIFNEALILMEALLYRGVVTRGVLDPAGISPSPANGDIYFVPDGSPTATGDWSGQGGSLAVYFDGWRFLPPQEGLTVWITDEAQSIQYRSGEWVELSEFAPQELNELTDVDFSGSPGLQDGDTLAYDAVLGKFTQGKGAAIGALEGMRVYQATATTGITSATKTIDFDVQDPSFLVSGAGMHDVSTNNSRLIAKSDGFWLATGQIKLLNADPYVFTQLLIRLDGATNVSVNQTTQNPAANTVPFLQVTSDAIYLAKDQYVELRAAFDPTDDTDVGRYNTWFTLRKVGV